MIKKSVIIVFTSFVPTKITIRLDNAFELQEALQLLIFFAHDDVLEELLFFLDTEDECKLICSVRWEHTVLNTRLLENIVKQCVEIETKE